MRPDAEEGVRQTQQLKKRGDTVTLTVNIEGSSVVGLLDSGANCSLLSEEWYRRHLSTKGVKLHKNSEFICDLSGNEINISGHIVVNVEVNGIQQENCVF